MSDTTPTGTPRTDPTAVPGLDIVLGGGLPRGSLTLVVGPPGSGKSTLAAQVAFAAARAGRRVLLLTAFSEPNTKLIAHLRTFTFFDDALVGDAIRVLSVQQYLDDGLAAAADALIAEARRLRAGLVIIDGFRGLRPTDRDAQAGRAFLYTVGTALSMIGATTLITSEAEPRDTALFSEATTADVLIGMHYQLTNVRARRNLEAVKVRGADALAGLHGLTLGPDGVRVYPRLEARVTSRAWDDAPDANEPDTPGRATPDARASFGLAELDALLEGGVTRDTVTLVFGSPGVGKTLLGLHFAVTGVRAGEPVVWLGFHETHRELLRKGEAFALGPELGRALRPDGGLTLLRQPAVERDPDVLADALLAAIERTGACRLVVDSLAGVERAVRQVSGAEREPNYLAALVEALRARGVTSLFIRESNAVAAPTLSLTADLVSMIAANVVWMQQVAYGDRLRRVLSVPKMRFSAHDVALHAFTITAPRGIQVLAPLESEPGVLADSARGNAGMNVVQAGGVAPDAPGEDLVTAPEHAQALVLIAEDEPPIAALVAAVVEDLGYTPILAAHGRQALEMARERQPVLLITDLMMPHMTGAELIMALQTEADAARQARVPVILMTAAGPRYSAGVSADAILHKPFDLGALEALIHRFLGRPA